MNKDVEVPPKVLPIFKSKKRNIVMYGGRGGSKSWAVAIALIVKAMTKRNQIILCTREVQNTIEDSVLSLLAKIIQNLNLNHIFDIQKNRIYCKNGSRFIFKGLSHKITGVKSTEGVNYCWIEEAQSVSQKSIDILWPTVRNNNSQFFVTFNPETEDDPIYRRFVTGNREDTLLIKVNYLDNPYFPDVLRKEMEWDKQYDYDKYLHVWEGNPKTITDACVFKGKFVVDMFNTHEGVDFYYGADWGFANDPTCLIRCYVYDNCLYIDYEAYGVGVEIDEIPQLFDSIPQARRNKIVADNQRSDTISYLNRKGFIIKPSRKGKNSIKDGIEFIKKFKKIYIHERCKNTAYEFMSYSYKIDKLTEEILPIIVDKYNHCIDAIRYSLEGLRRGYSQRYEPTGVKMQDLFSKNKRLKF